MADSTIAADLGQTLDIQSGLSSEVAFYQEVMVDAFTELGFFLIRKIFYSSVRVDTGFFENLFCAGSADAVDIGKAYLYSLIFGQVNAGYTCHTVSSFLSNNYSALVRTETWSRRRESPFPAGVVVCWGKIPRIGRQLLDQPCLCLCLGFSQITMTLPLRLMILHFSHIGFTEGLTFIELYLLLASPRDSAAGQIVR